MKQFILSMSAWHVDGFVHLPGFAFAETKEEAEQGALRRMRQHIFSVNAGWFNHTVVAGEAQIMARQIMTEQDDFGVSAEGSSWAMEQ